jgi:hypothetical protein
MNQHMNSSRRLARIILGTFLFTFFISRLIVFLKITGYVPGWYLYVRGIHIHHMDYGILLLAAVGACSLFARPSGRLLDLTAAVYAAGLALTFDEFGMWLYLGGSYWQPASWEAMLLLTVLLALIAFPLNIRRLKVPHTPGASFVGFPIEQANSLANSPQPTRRS